MKRACIALLSCLLFLGLCLGVGTEANAASILPLTQEESEQLFAGLSQVPFSASSGAGAWEGELSVHQDGSFTGHYSDADDDGIYEVTFSGRFSSSVEVHGHAYWLWVEEMTTQQTPGTRGVDEYGETVFYTEPPFAAWDYMVLTLPGTPDSEIPEMVQGEIGGTLDEWEDYSRFYTLTRRNDGWGFFGETDDDGCQPEEPYRDEWDDAILVWTGIWRSRSANSFLYIFWEEGGASPYQVIHVMQKDGEARAIRGALYFVDEITVDYDVPGLLHAGIVGSPDGNTLSLTAFSALDDRMTPWIKVIEGEYEREEFLDDPVWQIDPSIRDLAEIGLGPIASPTPTAAPNTSYKLPKNVSRLPNGNLRYDDGLIAFEAPGDALIRGNNATYNGKTGLFPENTTFTGYRVMIPSTENLSGFDGLYWEETQKRYFDAVIAGVVQLPPEVDATEFAWAAYEGLENTGYTTIAGRTAKYHHVFAASGGSILNDLKKHTELLIPLSGNRLFGIGYYEYPDAGRKNAVELFLNTLEIRDSLYAEPPTGPVQTALPAPTPVPTAAPDLSAWTGIWRVPHEQTFLYIFREESGAGDYQVIHVMEKYTEKTRAIRGSLYVIDEMTVDYDVPGILHAAIMRDPNGSTLSLTALSAVDERMESWIPVIENKYEFVRPLDDPAEQIDPSIWTMAEIGLGTIPDPTSAPVMDTLPGNREGDVMLDDDVCTITYLGKAVGSEPHFSYGPAAYYRLAITNHTDKQLTLRMISGTVNGATLWSNAFYPEETGYTSLHNYVPILAGETKSVCLWPLGIGYGYRHEEELVNAVIGIRAEGDSIQKREYTLTLNPGESYQPPQRTAGYQTRTEDAWQLSYEIPVDWEVYYRESLPPHLFSKEPSKDDDWIEVLPPPSAEEGIYHIRIRKTDSSEPDFAAWKTGETLVDGFPAMVYYDDYYTGYNVNLGGGKGLSFLVFHTEVSPEEAQPAEADRFIRSVRFTSAQRPAPTPTASPTPAAAPNTSYKLPKNVSRLPNGNLRYDDGLIAFEAPGDALIRDNNATYNGKTLFPENTTLTGYRVMIPSTENLSGFDGLYWEETQKRYFDAVIAGVVQLPPEVDATEFAWAAYEKTKEFGYKTVAGRTAKYGLLGNIVIGLKNDTELLIPLSGNRNYIINYYEYPDAGRKNAVELFLNTLEIRDSLYAEPPAGPVQTESPAPTPAPTAAPDLSAWTGYWMTRDDSLAEMIVTDNGNGTLHAQALFLPAGNHEATLTPQADGRLLFEEKYGNLIGRIERRPDGALHLAITGGSIMEDDEATEYQGYYARGFAFYPAAYEEMWYQRPEEAAATRADWLGNWTMLGGAGDSTLRIIEQNGDLRVEVTLGQYRFSGLGELAGDDALDLYTDDFSCMLLLNKKLNRIAMMEVGSDIEAVYDWAGNGYYGVVLYRKNDHPVSGPGDLRVDNMPPVLIMPVPTAPGATQIIVDLPTPAPMAAPEDDLGAEPWVGSWLAQSEGHTARMEITPGDMCDYFVRFTFDGQYTLNGQLAVNDDDTLNVYADDYIGQFGALLTMNEGQNAVVMDDVGCEVAEINAWLNLFRFKLTFVRQDAQPAVTDAPAQPGAALLPVPGRMDVMQVPVSYANATSWIVGSKDPYAYTPAKMIDGEETTAFQFSTKTTKPGREYLYFEFESPVTLDEMWMKNGFWKNADGKDQYTRNSRVKKMAIEVRYAGEEAYSALKTVSLKDDKARKDWKVIEMLHAENVASVRIRVDEIYKGSKFPNDVCISEIMFVQYSTP